MPEIKYLQQGDSDERSFPAVGHKYIVDYGGDFLVRFEFISINTLVIYGLKGKYKDFVETVEIHVTPIGEGLFMVAWQEGNKTTVVHVEDFKKGIIYANITQPENVFLRLQGPFKMIE